MNNIAYSNDFGILCLSLFSSVNKVTTYFLIPFFMLRIAIFNFTGSGPVDVGRLLKAVIVYFLLISTYGHILDIILLMPDYISELHVKNAKTFNHHNDLFLVPRTFRVLVESISIVAFRIGQGIFNIFVLVMSGLAPIIFLLGSLLGIGLGIKLFFGLLIISSTWPIIWYGIDLMFITMADGQSSVFILVLDLMASCLKVLMPFGIGFMAINSSPASFISTLTSKGASALGRVSKMGSKKAFNKAHSKYFGTDSGKSKAASTQRYNPQYSRSRNQTKNSSTGHNKVSDLTPTNINSKESISYRGSNSQNELNTSQAAFTSGTNHQTNNSTVNSKVVSKASSSMSSVNTSAATNSYKKEYQDTYTSSNSRHTPNFTSKSNFMGAMGPRNQFIDEMQEGDKQ